MASIKHHHPPYLPTKLDYGKFTLELADAQYDLGVLQGAQERLHNPGLLIAPLTAKEAATSSKIEGTQSSPKDIFMFEAGGKAAHNDAGEVANYSRAMNYAVEQLSKGRQLTASLTKTLHKILLTDTRHSGMLGGFRDKTVYIAERRSDPIEKALYIPPTHLEVPGYIDNIFQYLGSHNDNDLIKAGIMHYQFEAVHPFEDGNGRIGRLLIPLFLFKQSRITLPILYVSGYFERNRDQYREALSVVDKTNQYEHWLKFFFTAISAQAKETNAIISKINALYEKNRQTTKNVRSPYIIPFIDFIFTQPIFSATQARRKVGIQKVTCARLIKVLLEKGIVSLVPQKFTTDKREKLYWFSDLISLL